MSNGNLNLNCTSMEVVGYATVSLQFWRDGADIPQDGVAVRPENCGVGYSQGPRGRDTSGGSAAVRRYR